jgi:two-component system nitrate/nitrite response regulator NarL
VNVSDRARSEVPSPAARNVVYVTRQPLFAETLGRVLAHDGDWAVKVLDRDHARLLQQAVAAEPVVVVVEVDSDVVPSLQLISHLVEMLPTAAVIALGDLDGAAAAAFVHSGARGLLSHGSSVSDLTHAFEAAAAGRTTVEAVTLARLVGTCSRRQPGPTRPSARRLSPRESEVLSRIATGQSTRDIAEDLRITVQTVRKHTQHILGKLGVHSKLQAAAIAARDALV